MKQIVPIAIAIVTPGAAFAQAAEQPMTAIGLKLSVVDRKFGEEVGYEKDRDFQNDTLYQFRTAKVYTSAVFSRDSICIEVRFTGKFSASEAQALLAANGDGWKVLHKPSVMDRDYKDGVTYQDSRGNFARVADGWVMIRTPERMKNLEIVGLAPK